MKKIKNMDEYELLQHVRSLSSEVKETLYKKHGYKYDENESTSRNERLFSEMQGRVNFDNGDIGVRSKENSSNPKEITSMAGASSILNIMIASANQAVLENVGGMENFTETLQDSDTFYQEAKALGKLEALEEFKRALEGKDIDVSITSIVDAGEEDPLKMFKMN